MNITIIGDGKVGSTLARVLSKEDNNVIVIDKNPDVLSQNNEALEVITIEGSGLNIKTLHEAGVENDDLVIAVTNQDEINMICCLYAKRLGAKHTVARIRDPEHSEEVEALIEELGLDDVINPEYAGAVHISQLLLWPNVSDIELFAKNKVMLTKYKLEADSPLIGQSLLDATVFDDAGILVAAIERGQDTLIPKGDFVFQENDTVFIIGEINSVNIFFKLKNKRINIVREVTILGGGRISIYLAKILLQNHIGVKIIEQNVNICTKLSQLLPDAVIIHGDGTDYELLEFEAVHATGAFISLMGHDEANIIACIVAKALGVPKTIAKVTRLKSTHIIENIGIDSIVDPKLITANHILRYARNLKMKNDPSINALYMMNENDMEALEFAVEHDYPFLNIPLKQLKIHRNALIAVIVRNGQIIIPRGDDSIRLKDSIIVITSQPNIANLADIF